MIISWHCTQSGPEQPLSPTSVERAFASNCDALLDAAGLVDQQPGGQIRHSSGQAPAPAPQQQQQTEGGRVMGRPALPLASPSLPISTAKDMRSQDELGSQQKQLPGAQAAPSSSVQPFSAAAAAVIASAMRPRPALPNAPLGAYSQAHAASLLAMRPAQQPGQPPTPRPQPMLTTLVQAPAAGQPGRPPVQQPQPNIVVSQQRPLLVQPQTHVYVQQPWPVAMQQPRPATVQQARVVQQPGSRPTMPSIPVYAPSLPGPQLRPPAPNQAPVRPGAVRRELYMHFPFLTFSNERQCVFVLRTCRLPSSSRCGPPSR